MESSLRTVAFTLNGHPVEVAVREGETLLQTLRNRLGIKSVKDGCAPQGQCGCCLAIIDGTGKTTCSMTTDKIQGRTVTTMEGVSDHERDLLARCFTAAAGVQCGFCIPGIALRATAFVQKFPNPSHDDLARAFDGHLCRCTGYSKIFKAIELFAAVCRGDEPAPDVCTDGRIGEPLGNVSALKATLGDRPYVADLEFPGMLHGAVVLSDHPRAKVLRIDTSKAEALEGVVKVATYKDIPGERWTGLIYADWPVFVAEGEEVRYVGDMLAAVAAVDEHTARKAAALVEVTYEALPALLDPFDSLIDGAPQVNPKHANELSKTVLVRGDAEQALAQSAHVIRGRWQTQRIEHLFLEPESCVARILEDGRMHVYSQGQGIFDDQRWIARMIDQPIEQVHVELVPSGGAFGGKEDMSVQAQTALLCHLTRQPVRITLSREQSVRVHPKRHPVTMDYEVGCDAEGRLTVVRAKMIGDSGAYASVGGKVLERAAGHACGPYRVPVVDIVARAAYTNNPPCGAMRGFGVCQTAFAIEACVDLLAEKVGLDRWQMRWLNAVDIGDMYSTGQILEKSVGLKKTLLEVKPIYDAALARGQAVGIACGLKNSGLGNGAVEFGRARLVVEPDQTISVYNCFSEMGQGLLTITVQCAVEVTGLPAAIFRPKVDTTYAIGSGQTTGSRGTLLAGRAVKDAAEKLKLDLELGKSVADLVGQVYEGEIRIDDTTAPSVQVAGQAPAKKIKTHTSFGFATQLVLLDAQGRVESVVAAHDVGRALNPAACTGQIEGAVVMGLGYALTEALDTENGWPTTYKLKEIGALRTRDIPPIDVRLIEEYEPEGPFGGKGVGEIGLVPTAAAVAGALRAHDGVLRTKLPMRDSPAARAMSVGKLKIAAPRSAQ